MPHASLRAARASRRVGDDRRASFPRAVLADAGKPQRRELEVEVLSPLLHHGHGVWARCVRTMTEQLSLRIEDDAIVARHRFGVFKLPFLELRYRITPALERRTDGHGRPATRAQ